MLRDVFYYGMKPNVHPRERFATSLQDARNQCATEHFWVINEFCDYRNFDWDFDFDFLPDEEVWTAEHNNVWPSIYQKDSGTWLCSKEDSNIIIYRNDVEPLRRKNEKNDYWTIVQPIDESKFDFGWHPDPTSPPLIYKWGCKFFPAQLKHVLEYHVPGATQEKYMDTIVELLPQTELWVENDLIDKNKFDMSWRPDPLEPAYIYKFGTKYCSPEISAVLEYHAPDATEIKYMNSPVATLIADMSKWEVPADIDVSDFDFSWKPNPYEPAFIYQFGTQHQKTGGPRYVAPDATKVKYIDTCVLKSRKLPSRDNWEVPAGLDVNKFDFSWHPDDTADPVIYQFGSVVGKDDGPRYVVENNDGKVLFLENIEVAETVSKEINKYYIETTLEDLINEHQDEVFWALNKTVNYDTFDFTWRPDVYQSNFVHVFGQSENTNSQTYYINSTLWAKGFSEFNFVEEQVKKKVDELDMFYVDRGNSESDQRFNMLKSKYPKLQKTRYLNSWVDTIIRCTNRATSNLIWVLNSELDYNNFNFDYYPNPWQMKMVHVFGTQWSRWGTTFMVNRESFPQDTKYVKVIEHLNNLNFVKDNRATATKCIYDIILIDHGNSENTSVLELLKKKAGDKNVVTYKYDTSYLKTLTNIISRLSERKEHYLWICSSVCDYKDFDFSYICDPYAKDQLHVFPTGRQKFGDTFFIDVNKARELINELKLLEEYQKVNYNATMRVPRLPEPVIITTEDTLVDVATHIDNWPYATVVTDDNKDIETVDIEPMNLWAPETKNILVTSTGSSRIIVPCEVKDYVKKELYDYPYIKKSARLAKSNPMDIVFLSNGETGADENYEHLLNVTKGLKNRVVRVDGVNGRVQAYHAVAEASNTPWAFTVFAKLKVNNKFDWNWQPDRMQVAKHYIFQAKNPVNGLVYGHQAMIAYNKKLTLANTGKGLDFTLDDEHEVVELLSGTAVYNTDSFTTWRTAFREVLKLRDENSEIAQQRIDKWVNVAEGDFAEYSIKGATNALEFYDEVNGDFNELKKSYEWVWLRDRFSELGHHNI